MVSDELDLERSIEDQRRRIENESKKRNDGDGWKTRKNFFRSKQEDTGPRGFKLLRRFHSLKWGEYKTGELFFREWTG